MFWRDKKMAGQRKKFTEAEIRLLAANPYTYRITESVRSRAWQDIQQNYEYVYARKGE